MSTGRTSRPGNERRLLLLLLDFPPHVFGIVLRLAVWRQQTLKEYYALRQKLPSTAMH